MTMLLESKLVYKAAEYSLRLPFSYYSNYAGSYAKQVPIPNLTENVPRSKTNFDINKVVIEPGHPFSAEQVKPFLYTQYFKQQPHISNLLMRHDSSYLAELSKRYTTTGNQWLAFQIEPRMRTRRLIGTMVAYLKFPWEARKLEQAASSAKANTHLKFCAECFRKSNVFFKYKVPYIYDIELLAMAADVNGMGAEDLLLQAAFVKAIEHRFPLVQVFTTNDHLKRACERASMMEEWSMYLSDFVEDGECIFNVKDPNASASVYIRLFSPRHEVSFHHILPPKQIIKKPTSVEPWRMEKTKKTLFPKLTEDN